jgi:hypothetical protein
MAPGGKEACMLPVAALKTTDFAADLRKWPQMKTNTRFFAG